MVKAATEPKCPIRPKQGTILVASRAKTEGGLSKTAAGLYVPSGDEHELRLVEVIALGAKPLDLRSGVEYEWQYALGDILIVSERIEEAWLPIKYQGRRVAIINDAHVVSTWLGE